MATYELFANYLGGFKVLTVSQREYEDAKKAMEFFRNVLDVEENFDIAYRMYVEAEVEALRLSSEHSYFNDFGTERFYNYRVCMNAKVSPFLFASRFYIDKLDSYLKKTVSVEKISKLKEFVSLQYDTCKYYPLMYRLRNYAAHGQQPVHSLKVGGFWDEKREHLSSVFEMYCDKEKLSSFDIPRRILDDFEDKISITLGMRKFTESLGKILTEYRKERQESHFFFEEKVMCLFDKYIAFEDKAKASSVLSLRHVENGDEVDGFLLHDRNIKLISMLEFKNKHFNAISRRHISGRVG